MGFVNLHNPAFVLIVHRFGEPFLSGMCIVLVHEKVSVVSVTHKKSTPSIMSGVSHQQHAHRMNI